MVMFPIAIVVCILALVAIYMGAWRTNLAVPYEMELGPGDPDYDFAFALAVTSCIPIEGVRIVEKLTDRRVCALDGIIALTPIQRSELTEQERQVLLTQWVGAVKFVTDTRRSNIIRAVWASLVIFALCLIAIYGFGWQRVGAFLVVPSQLSIFYIILWITEK